MKALILMQLARLPGADQLVEGDSLAASALATPWVLSGSAWQKLVLTSATVLLAWLVGRLLVRWFVVGLEDKRHRYQWRKGVSYVVTGLAILVIATIWVDGLTQIGTFLGLLTAGIAIALRDVVADLAGWIFIIWKRPFRLGDRIQIGSHSGDVVDVSILQCSIIEIGNWVDADQSTGRLIHIPNAKVLSSPLANYMDEFPFVWHKIPVLVTFESDWRVAKAILEGIVEEVSEAVGEKAREALRRSPGKTIISYERVSGTVYTSVRGDGVLLTLRFLVEPRQRRGMEEMIWERILDAFEDMETISFAYRTQRMYREPHDHALEAAARAGSAVADEPPGL